MTKEEIRLQQEIQGYNTYEKRKTNDEVFTPPFLIEEMLDNLPQEVWSDPTKTWLDPCAGLGNFSVIILKRLMVGLEKVIPDDSQRKRHILENQLFHVEMNQESVDRLQKVLNPDGEFSLNIHCGDFLKFADEHMHGKTKPLIQDKPKPVKNKPAVETTGETKAKFSPLF